MAGAKNIDLVFLQSMIDNTEPGVKINSYEVSDDVKLQYIILLCKTYGDGLSMLDSNE